MESVNSFHEWYKHISDKQIIIHPDFQDAHHELHCFSDASKRAYGCCIYIRSINKLGNIYTSLVCSESRPGVHTFVSNRVSAVRNRYHSDQWHHISVRFVSRGVHLKTLDKQLWLYGPLSLSTYKGNWSTQNAVSYNVPDDDPESMTGEKIVFLTATYVHPVDKICHNQAGIK